MSCVLETRGLTVAFGGLTAVDKLDIELGQRELLGLIGPNGAGKTTVFNLITGMYKPVSGDVLFHGKSLVNVAPYDIVGLGIARTFQNIRLFASLSVLENVMLGHAIRVREGLLASVVRGSATVRRRRDWVKRARDLLAFVGLEGYEEELATNLPYGRQRLLEIARALATECEVLLLDEPAAGMNQPEKQALIGLVNRVRDEMGKTVLLIEHDMRLVVELVDRIVVIDHGRKIAEGTPDYVKNHPAVIEAYLGAPLDAEAI